MIVGDNLLYDALGSFVIQGKLFATRHNERVVYVNGDGVLNTEVIILFADKDTATAKSANFGTSPYGWFTGGQCKHSMKRVWCKPCVMGHFVTIQVVLLFFHNRTQR